MIYINDIPSFRDPENLKMTVDDRITRVEIINGVAYQDYGHVEEGDVWSITCLFEQKNFLRLVNLWNSRSTVTFTDTAGDAWQDLLIVMKEYERDKNFRNYVKVTFELWKIPKYRSVTP